VQLRAFDADERIGVAPQWLQLDVTQHFALLGKELLTAHDRSRMLDGCVDAELVEYARGIGLHGNAPADGLPARIALYEIGIESVLMQCGGETETG
jgi:hypothetical protein